MSEILLSRPPVTTPVTSVRGLTSLIEKWHNNKNVSKEGRSLSRIWFRGNAREYANALRPKVYRERFVERAKNLFPGVDDPAPNLERELLKEFRMSGAQHFHTDNIADIYFIAQHFGMPTRLLDWTTNPLIALYFATREHQTENGEIFVMDALGVLPDRSKMSERDAEKVPTEILTMRDGHVKQTLERSFWVCPEPELEPVPGPSGRTWGIAYTASSTGWVLKYPKGLILPVRPDNRPGRIGQQSSCFTLHGIESDDLTNPTLDKFVVAAAAKAKILYQLGRLNINQFTIFDTLDHLSAAICESWKIARN